MVWRAIVFAAAGVIVGFALGGVPLRRELEAMRAERDALRVRLAQASRPNLFEALLPGLGASERAAPSPAAREPLPQRQSAEPAPGQPGDPPAERPAPSGDVAVIGADPKEAQARTAASARADGFESGSASPGAEPAPYTGDARPESEPERDRPRRRPRELLAGFDQLVTAQRARTAAARSALIEQAGLDGERLARFDNAVTRMNGKLAGYGEEVIAQAASEEPPSPAQMLGLGHDVSGILYEGQKELDSLVGERADGVDPSALEIWNYIDLEQWRPYVEQQLARGGETPGSEGTPPAQPEPPGGGGAAGSEP